MDGISSPATFKHEPLPDATNHMRLLEVFDRDYSDTIRVRCGITTWPVDSMPWHSAISYVWGDSKPDKTILINDKTFQVGTSCELVLKQIHAYEKSRYYWIDAICIDQKNLDEKSKQLAMMGNIYKKADHVLACLGRHADDSRFLFQNFEQFSRTVREPADRLEFQRLLYTRYGLSTSRRLLRALFHFAERPYFSRLWILQELKNAKQASLLCEDDAVPKDEFELVLGRLVYYFYSPRQKPLWKLVSVLLRPSEGRKDHRLRKCQGIFKLDLKQRILDTLEVISPDVNLDGLVTITRRLQCSNPKYKMFAIISLLESGGVCSVVPDYTKSDFENAVELLRALWNNAELRFTAAFDPWRLCFYASRDFELTQLESEGISEALKARETSHGYPRTSRAAESWLIDPLPRARVAAFGWRISAGDLSKDYGRFKCWNLPGHPAEIFLPYWIKKDDWVICWETRFEESFLVLREEADSLWMPVVGHGWCESFDSSDLVADAFEIRWNPEDALIFTITRLELRREKERSNHWLEALNTGICKRKTSGSSYGVKVQQ